MTTEEKAKAYAEKRTEDCVSEHYGSMMMRRRVERFDSYDIEQAYEDGATEALASQWKDSKVELPEDDTLVVVWINSTILTDYCESGEWHYRGVRFWLPIPPLKGGEACL